MSRFRYYTDTTIEIQTAFYAFELKGYLPYPSVLYIKLAKITLTCKRIILIRESASKDVVRYI